ncbi:MAG: hypothetical protein RIR29_402, partial [Actinomycetota bacterium]
MGGQIAAEYEGILGPAMRAGIVFHARLPSPETPAGTRLRVADIPS